MNDDKLAVGEIAKIDDDQQLVFGWASIIKDEEGRLLVDRQDDFIKEEGELEKSAYEYVLESRDGGEMHIRKGVSTMVESVVLTKEKQQAMGITEDNVPVGWWVGFKVNDDRVWGEVKKGGYSGFSVHGKGKRTKKVLSDGSYTDVGKNAKEEVERPSPEEMEEIERHRKKYGDDHAKAMIEAIRSGSTMEQSHNIANKMAVSKGDCGCNDCSGQSVLVEKKFLTLLTKAQTASQEKIKTVMGEFKNGTLKSSDGKKVTSSKQAMAIALSEAGISKHKGVVHEDDGRLKANKKKKVKKGDFAGHPFRGNQHTGGIYHGSSGKKIGKRPKAKPSKNRRRIPEKGEMTESQRRAYDKFNQKYGGAVRKPSVAGPKGGSPELQEFVARMERKRNQDSDEGRFPPRVQPRRHSIKDAEREADKIARREGKTERGRTSILDVENASQAPPKPRRFSIRDSERAKAKEARRAGKRVKGRTSILDAEDAMLNPSQSPPKPKKPEFIKDLPPEERKAFVADNRLKRVMALKNTKPKGKKGTVTRHRWNQEETRINMLKTKAKLDQQFPSTEKQKARGRKVYDKITDRSGNGDNIMDKYKRTDLKGGKAYGYDSPSDRFYKNQYRGKNGLARLQKERWFVKELTASERDAFLRHSDYAKTRGLTEAYVAEKEGVKKGDFAGHPFRGNQHTGGIYHGSAGMRSGKKKGKTLRSRSGKTRVMSPKFESRFSTPPRKRPRLKSDASRKQKEYLKAKEQNMNTMKKTLLFEEAELKMLEPARLASAARMVRARNEAEKALDKMLDDRADKGYVDRPDGFKVKRVIEKFRRLRKEYEKHHKPTELPRSGSSNMKLDDALNKFYDDHKKADEEMSLTFEQMFFGGRRYGRKFEDDTFERYEPAKDRGWRDERYPVAKYQMIRKVLSDVFGRK